jgi:hypothetical protein
MIGGAHRPTSARGRKWWAGPQLTVPRKQDDATRQDQPRPAQGVQGGRRCAPRGAQWRLGRVCCARVGARAAALRSYYGRRQ